MSDYVALAVEDPKQSWERLTPEFQRASGGFGRYKQYWDQWESAVAANIQADPESGSVNYDITYHDEDGETTNDNVTLELVDNDDGGFLIAGEGG